MRGSLGLLLLAVLGACATWDEPAPAPAGAPGTERPRIEPPEPSPALEQPQRLAPAPASQAVFEQHCGECHRGDRETAKPGALAVFDLTDEGWLAGMTKAQLEAAVGRIKGKSEVGDDEQRAALSALDEELARRR